MPRELTLGNGSLQVMFDAAYQLRDIYFPYVGQENHTAGHVFRFGVFTDGQLSWVNETEWERDLVCEPNTLVTTVKLINRQLGLRLDCRDAVDFHENIYLRETTVHNLVNRPREICLFFHHDFYLYENNVADTAFYEPRLQAILHYKGYRYFLISAQTDAGGGIEEWAIGIKEHKGAEGNWRDAEDGHLGKNPIAQGSVDSTIALRMSLPADGKTTCYYWIAAGTKYREVKILNDIVLEKTSAGLINRTGNYWQLWANKNLPDFTDLAHEVVGLYQRSLLILRRLTDNHGGIIAANDSDLLPCTTFGRAARATPSLWRAPHLGVSVELEPC